jgi:hypothetical protein
MEAISDQDISYLIALAASEESKLIEIQWEFAKWDCDKNIVLVLLRSLINDGTILLSKPDGEKFNDLDKEKALLVCATWDSLQRKDLILFLTSVGDERWEKDDWDITTKRAKHLMFNNQKRGASNA